MKLESSRQAVSIADVAQVEQLPPARPARRLPDQHRVGREKGGEHDDVAEQENPEAIADDDALRRQLAGRVLGGVPAIPVVPDAIGSPRPAVAWKALMAPPACGRAPRCARFGWPGRCARPRRPE